jgi:hypothetical protein
MTKKILILWMLFVGVVAQAQTTSTDFRSKKIIVTQDTIRFDSVPINPERFKVLNSRQRVLYPTEYQVLYKEAILIVDAQKYQEITIEYFRFPEFITKAYSPFDKRLIVPNNSNTGKLYSLTTNKKGTDIQLFDGLKTSGFITRGLTVGNNQSTVTNSSMDLNIQGKLSDKVSIRANIFDTNIPIQENGYSQSITDFDRIFIELYSKDWRVKAGDVSLKNSESFFLTFEKQVAGLEVEANIKDKTNVLASGAVVRGQFTAYNFVGVEGNQGPYKILGPNNEPNFVIIGGSDRVFVNGSPIERGPDKDYVIDYNMGEIRFNTRFPITNDMRIRIEFQFSNRNYTRFVTYEKAKHTSENFQIAGYFYNENDVKNQPIQLSLTQDQIGILANAGNNPDLMVAESAFPDTFDPNRILYRRVQVGTTEVFEYSTNEDDELFNVTFTNVGANQGDYVLDQTLANGNVFAYVGPNLGDFDPIVQLIAPTKLQIALIDTEYKPSEKTSISAELAYSNNDLNLFSDIDNDENQGVATKVNWQQTLSSKKWQLQSDVDYLFIHENFNTIQRFQAVEFNRDWNLFNPQGNQQQISVGLTLKNKENDYATYSFQQLKFTDNYEGSKHLLNAKMKLDSTYFFINSSFLNNNSEIQENTFVRILGRVEQSFQKSWAGAFVNIESNDGTLKATQEKVLTNHKFQEYEAYAAVGDSTKVFAKVGFNFRNNDSIRANQFTEINNRKTFYLDSRLVQTERTNLSLYANYRITENAFIEDEKALNSRLIYNQQFFKNFLSIGTRYETSSGNVAQQDFVYIEVETGQGVYQWIDYNGNGVQEFDEFEIAQFQDQANYLRVPLPNLRFIPTQRAMWNQSITLNAKQWQHQKGIKKVLSHFSNQFFMSINNEQERVGNSFNLNPFDLNEEKQISLNFSIRNSLYFNRGQQKYSTTYTYGTSENKQQFLIGDQDVDTKNHQLEFVHRIGKFWLLDILGKVSENDLETENFANRNYEIDEFEIRPKISYEANANHRFSAFYQLKNKENQLQDFEELRQQKLGIEYFYTGKEKSQFNATFNAFFNDFSGDSNSPVGFQMLEGLQAGTNYTWSLLWNQKLNSFLNLNLNYRGRRSENVRTIHTGSVQLRAVF